MYNLEVSLLYPEEVKGHTLEPSHCGTPLF